ncbi:MAG TPA: sensor histidine kinase [Spirochaetota bacterium]|nr:sensor histidine kinase [Spirochaetota bacterium]HPR38389.1 sensor histidine kinase [Spirochaetota bacterium]
MMKNRVILILNDSAVARKMKRILDILDDNSEIITCESIDLDRILLHSPELVIIGSSAIKNDNDVMLIQKAQLLELPVILLSSGAELNLDKFILEKALRRISPDIKPIHKYLMEEIFKGGKGDDSGAINSEPPVSDDHALTLLKELKSLYFISDIMNIPDLSVEAVLRYTHDSIEKALYHDDAKVRISCVESVFESSDFAESDLKIESPVLLNGKEVGAVEVFYLHENLGSSNYHLKLENDFINAVSERIANYLKSKELINQLARTNEELRDLSSHLQDVRESERKMVARTIHDEFGQKLINLRFEIQTLRRQLPEQCAEIEPALVNMNNLIDVSMKTLRQLSTSLRPGVLDNLGIAAAIEWLARDIEKRTSVKFCVRCSPEDMILDDDYTTALFRIFQEATTNIIHHSGATEVVVNLKETEGEVFLIVLDNGKGISDEDMERGDSFGIKGMRERALSFQGTFSISRNFEEGTVLKVSLPLHHDRKSCE